VAGKDIDALARGILADAGYGNMPHNLGHGLGRLVHDAAGLLSPSSKLSLHENVVLTVEPGIYIEGYGAVRIEDDVLVTATGFERLTQYTRDLVVIGG
jgi:Xaa-Pro aminopeptidase